jgi:presequence protease
MFNELTSGVDYYRFITQLDKNFDTTYDALCRKLQQTANAIFTTGNLLIHVTCPADDVNLFSRSIAGKLASLPKGKPIRVPWKFNFSGNRGAILSSSQVQYVVKSFDFKKLGYTWNGSMIVLNQILTTDWLQNQIRVQGGAYGGFSGITPGGHFYLASYRDPNLKETLEAFDATPGYVTNLQLTEQEMTRYVIGAIASLDQPKTPSQKGSAAMHWYFEQTTGEMLNGERTVILQTTAEDIRKMATMISDILKQNNYCVYGNETKINANATLFTDLIRIASGNSECFSIFEPLKQQEND